MSLDNQKDKSRLKKLIRQGKEQGYLTYAEVNDHLPEEITDPEQIEDIINMINAMGISVFESIPDNDNLFLGSTEEADETIIEEAADALASVEEEERRTTDPVRMYMREMGTVELLTREGEIEISKRIEESSKEIMSALVTFPGSIKTITDKYKKIVASKGRFTDLLSDYGDSQEFNDDNDDESMNLEEEEDLSDDLDDDSNQDNLEENNDFNLEEMTALFEKLENEELDYYEKYEKYGPKHKKD